jgi:hypothetical protein
MSQAHRREPSPHLIPLDFDGAEVLSVDVGPQARGWAAYFSPPVIASGALVLLRLAPQAPDAQPQAKGAVEPDVPLEVREVRVVAAPGAAGFVSSLLREVPVLRIEAAINQTVHRRQLAAKVFASNPVGMEGVAGGSRFQRAPSKMPNLPRRSLTVEDPGGYRKPDEFYRQVADLYLHLAAVTGRPAHELAQANNLPVATMHRWIREAKARQILLLPTHRGGVDR